MRKPFNTIIQGLIILFMVFVIDNIDIKCIYAGNYALTPREVVEQYVRMDYEGKGLTGEGNKELFSYTNWIDGPAWDTVMVVTGYSIGVATIQKDIAFVPVKYKVLGSIDGYAWNDINSKEFTADDRKEIDPTFVLVKSGERWAIKEPQYRPHASVGVVRDHIKHLMKDSSHPVEQRKELENTINILNRFMKDK